MSGQFPVTVKLCACNGQVLPLPPLRSWEILRTDGDGCDAISLCTQPTYSAETLRQVNTLTAFCNGRTVFAGYVDEIELSASEQGRALTISGRGCAARLLDNQVPGEHFLRLMTNTLLERYVYPLGVHAEQPASATVPRFEIPCGSSVMLLLQSFCAHAGLLPPMFDDRGNLLLRRKRPRTGVHFGQDDLLAARYCDRRYGVISRMDLVHAVKGTVQSASYPAFQARGGKSRHYAVYTNNETAAGWRTARQRIDAARREEFTLELSVMEQFPCQPAGIVTASLPEFGVEGEFFVHQVRSVGSDRGCYAVVSLRKE